MIDQTNAFKVLKTEQQRIMNFSKLVCYAVPNLKKAIKGYKEKVANYESIAKPDYFVEPLDIDQVEDLTKHYKDNLSKYVLISAFSFFESYFRDVISELAEFHGGVEKLVEHVQQLHQNLLKSYSPQMISKRQKLQTRYKKKKWQKYEKILNELERELVFRHPSELFTAYGIKSFFEIVLSNGFKSVMIPDLLEIGLGVYLSDKINKHADLVDKSLRETFDIMRDIRNSIGHGKGTSLGFDKVMDLMRFLRFISVKVDNHLIENFFVIQNRNSAE